MTNENALLKKKIIKEKKVLAMLRILISNNNPSYPLIKSHLDQQGISRSRFYVYRSELNIYRSTSNQSLVKMMNEKVEEVKHLNRCFDSKKKYNLKNSINSFLSSSWNKSIHTGNI
jgi:hypothetical protein